MPKQAKRKRHIRPREVKKQDQCLIDHVDHGKGDLQNGEKAPASESVNFRQSQQQTRREGAQSIQKDDDLISCEIVPINPSIKKQPTIHKQEFNNEQSNPTTSNQTSSQITQAKEDTIKPSKKKRRRARKQAFKQKEELLAQQPSRESVQTDRSVEDPVESYQSTERRTYYAIRNGAYGYNGVHTDWNVCARYLKDTCGATFKSFGTLDEAFEFAHGDGSHEQPLPQKKLKREMFSPSGNVIIDISCDQGTQKESVEEDKASEGSQPHTPDDCLNEQRSRTVTPPKSVQPSQVDRLPKDGQPPETAKRPKRERTSKNIRRPTERIHCSEEVRLQSWKVEPVLLPTSLFSSEDAASKREESLIPIETSRTSF